jgi:hemin uptake protein HemP
MHAIPLHPTAFPAVSVQARERRETDAVEIDSARLLRGQREIVIRHGNDCYRLRHTRNDKLILTK